VKDQRGTTSVRHSESDTGAPDWTPFARAQVANKAAGTKLPLWWLLTVLRNPATSWVPHA